MYLINVSIAAYNAIIITLQVDKFIKCTINPLWCNTLINNTLESYGFSQIPAQTVDLTVIF